VYPRSSGEKEEDVVARLSNDLNLLNTRCQLKTADIFALVDEVAYVDNAT
jgi:hypothetical protein